MQSSRNSESKPPCHEKGHSDLNKRKGEVLRQIQTVVERGQAKKDTNFRWEWAQKAEKAREHGVVLCLCVNYENESRK